MCSTGKTFSEYIAAIDFKLYFEQHLLSKKGGGRDRMSPKKYKDVLLDKEIDEVKRRCMTGDYRFSPYNEKLFLKGKGKVPRVISIPSVRDRLVLSILNDFLTELYKDEIHKPPANKLVAELWKYCRRQIDKGESCYFYKTDFDKFYDNIAHQPLLDKLSKRVDESALKLICSAIETPTVSCKTRRIPNEIGVPQGLAISNILSEIYLLEFHQFMMGHYADELYVRYVDDILIVTHHPTSPGLSLAEANVYGKAQVKYSVDKTFHGWITDSSFDFLGYHINSYGVTPKASNQNNYANRLVRRCMQIVRQYNNPLLRPTFAHEDDDFLGYAGYIMVPKN